MFTGGCFPQRRNMAQGLAKGENISNIKDQLGVKKVKVYKL